ncbi:MAG: DUF2459 domain-containing protein [Nitrospirota bacterium]
MKSALGTGDRMDRLRASCRAWGDWAAVGLLLFTCGCAGPVRELWPPQPGAPSRTVIVSLDTWHAMIAFPLSGQPAASDIQTSAFSIQRFEEWGYAEQGWYLEGRQGPGGVLRVLFRFPPGVVEVGEHGRVWADRTPEPPSDRFTFQLSEEGYGRLRRHLQTTLASSEPVLVTGESRFYPAARSYNLLAHQCHQYVANALREAGLPVSPAWAFSRSSFAAQLRRAVRLAEEADGSPAPEAAPAASRASNRSKARPDD